MKSVAPSVPPESKANIILRFHPDCLAAPYGKKDTCKGLPSPVIQIPYVEDDTELRQIEHYDSTQPDWRLSLDEADWVD